LVGLLRGHGEQVRRLVEILVVAEGPGGVGVAGDLEEALDDIDADTTGHFARLVAAHAVADDRDAVLGEEQESVLVVVAFAADIGGAGELKGHRSRHSIAEVVAQVSPRRACRTPGRAPGAWLLSRA